MTILDFVEAAEPTAPALRAPERTPLSYRRLRELMLATADVLERLGIGPGDCVATVLPGGAETAAVLLGIADRTVVAPLNPALSAEEIGRHALDLHARAIVLGTGTPPAAAAAARATELPIAVVAPRGAEAGSYGVEVAARVSAVAPVRSFSPETALLLHTSGTTSRPKLVAIGRDQLCRSAMNIGRTLALTPRDVCLSVMPLFHVHGLIGAIVSSIAAGAAAYCPPQFNALRFFGWLADSGATWYTAVPTMHQAILRRARGRADQIGRHALRFVRSSSAPLPDTVWDGLESVFGVPALNAYGMTEAAHQVSSNPLPPATRKRGTVGLSTGPAVAILDEGGDVRPAGAPGEVALRGETVITAYERPPEANLSSFVRGWFRTGDQGVVDRDGYLTLTGRLKELINCGGEKLSPFEIEDVLLAHPAVVEAVSFAIPHPTLGEAVGAAVVLSAPGRADERALRRHVEDHLAAFKVPRTILILEELPKGPTGKLQRIGMAHSLGLGAE